MYHFPVTVALTSDRVLGNAESGVFLRQLLVLYAYFPAGDSNLRQFFFLLTRLKLLKNT